MCVCVCVRALLCVFMRSRVCVCAYIYACIIILIILRPHFQPGVVNKDGRTPLRLAVQNGKLEIVNYLITEQNIEPTGKYQ